MWTMLGFDYDGIASDDYRKGAGLIITIRIFIIIILCIGLSYLSLLHCV